MVRPPARFAYTPDTPTEPDRALLRRYAAGDHAAFAALLDRHGPLVLGACRRVLGSGSALADDAFQATFLVLARKAARLRDPDALPGWLFGVARRVAAAARRRDLRHDKTLRAAAKPEAAKPAGEWDDLLAAVDDEIGKLPDELRAPVLLCLYHGKTQDEAAAELGWSHSTLRRRLDRGRELLRSRLTTRGVAPAVALVAGAVAPSATSAVPVELRAAALDLAAGGSVPSGVTGLVPLALPRAPRPGWVIAGLAAVGVAAGAAAWAVLDRPAPVPVAAAPVVPQPPEAEYLPDAPAAPLPPRAVVRIGTTRFRHGTDGARGMVDPTGLTRLVFLPDGTLASVGGTRARFWDTAAGTELYAAGPGIPSGSKWALRALPFDDGRRLLMPETDADGTLLAAARGWSLLDRTPGRRIDFARHEGRKGDVIGPTAVSTDGTRFAQTDGNGDGWTWDADGKPLAKLAGKVPDFGLATFLPGAAELVTACPDGRFRVWDVATGKELRAFGEPAEALAAAASADGTRVATVSDSDDPGADTSARAVVVWDTARGVEVGRFALGGPPAFVARGGALAFTPDARHLVAVAHANDKWLDVRWWALDGSASGHWSAHSGGCRAYPLAVSNDLRVLAVGSGDAEARSVVRVFDGKTGRERVPKARVPGPVRGIAFAAGGKEVVTTMRSGSEDAWDAATGAHQWLAMSTPPAPPRAEAGFDVLDAIAARGPFDPAMVRPGRPVVLPKVAAVSPDGARVAVGVATFARGGGGWGRVYVLDRATRAVAWSAPTPDAPTSLAFRPDGARLAVGSTVVGLYATADGAPGPVLDGHRGAVTALAFSPDGRRLASGSADATAVVWDVE